MDSLFFDPVFIVDPTRKQKFCPMTPTWSDTHVHQSATENELVFYLDCPGLSKQDVKVTLTEGNLLSVAGGRTKPDEESEEEQTNQKQETGEPDRSFQWSVRLPKDADVQSISAHVEHGVAKIVVPKAPEPEPMVVAVN